MLLLKEDDDASSLYSPTAIRLLESYLSGLNRNIILLQEISSELKEINTKFKEMAACIKKTSK
jgi:hypothetical protein